LLSVSFPEVRPYDEVIEVGIYMPATSEEARVDNEVRSKPVGIVSIRLSRIPKLNQEIGIPAAMVGVRTDIFVKNHDREPILKHVFPQTAVYFPHNAINLAD
jgi:hypothetical protein